MSRGLKYSSTAAFFKGQEVKAALRCVGTAPALRFQRCTKLIRTELEDSFRETEKRKSRQGNHRLPVRCGVPVRRMISKVTEAAISKR